MGTVDCPREQDVLDALAAGRWPARCEDELRAHVAECGVCADVIEVVKPMREAHDELWPTIQIPPAGTVWWRAQLRARQEAARNASRPITVAQVLAGVAAVVALVGVFYAAAPWLSDFNFTAPVLPSLELGSLELPTLAELGLWGWVAIIAFLTWAVISPLVIYLAED